MVGLRGSCGAGGKMGWFALWEALQARSASLGRLLGSILAWDAAERLKRRCLGSGLVSCRTGREEAGSTSCLGKVMPREGAIG